MINTITPGLFAAYPDAAALAAVEPAALEPLIFKSGFYRNKAKSLVGMARALVERHGGNVPETMAELVELPGVARKTGNVVLSNALGKSEGVVVDTHVMRLSQRLGLSSSDDPVDIEQDLMKLLPQDRWATFANRLIWHGRRVCMAKNPDHEHCILAPVCPTYALVQLGKSPLTKPAKNGKGARKVKRGTKKPLAKKPTKKPKSKARPR